MTQNNNNEYARVDLSLAELRDIFFTIIELEDRIRSPELRAAEKLLGAAAADLLDHIYMKKGEAVELAQPTDSEDGSNGSAFVEAERLKAAIKYLAEEARRSGFTETAKTAAVMIEKTKSDLLKMNGGNLPDVPLPNALIN